MHSKVMRVDVKPALLRWARERAGMDIDTLTRQFPKYGEWESGAMRPTLKQLERFAKSVYAPVGSLFLSQPLHESIPIPDFRTVEGAPLGRLSPNLLETIYLCQQRQEWYRDFALIEGGEQLRLVSGVLTALGTVAEWVVGKDYTPAAIDTFLQTADYYLFAHARANDYEVVTHEIPSDSKNRIKIPDVCIGLGIKCLAPFEMLRHERARFVLGS